MSESDESPDPEAVSLRTLDLAPPPPADEPPLATRLRGVDELLGTAEVAVLCVLVAGLVGVSSYQVLSDYVIKPSPRPLWPFELIRYGVFFIAMVGGALAAQKKGMFNMDLVTRRFSARGRSVLRVGSAVLVAVMCGLVIKAAFNLRSSGASLNESYEFISTSRAYLALVVGFTLIGLHFLLHAGIEVAFLAAGKVPPDPPHGGH